MGNINGFALAALPSRPYTWSDCIMRESPDMRHPAIKITPRLARLVAGFLAGLLFASGAQAVAIGELQLRSRLGEPLLATVALGKLGRISPHELIVGQALEEDYRKHGISRTEFSGSLRFELEVDERDNASVRISTSRPLNEPFVDLLLMVRWPNGRALKEFTILLDPAPE